MKIALIHCPFGHKKFSENIKVVDEEFCLAPPIVLAYVAAILERAGHKVIIIDANALKLAKEEVLRILKNFSADAVCFRADTYWFHNIVEWAGYFKDLIKAKIIVGGINITLYPKESLSYECFDYGIIGEANKSLVELINAFGNIDKIRKIKGIVYRDLDQLIINEPDSEALDFNGYPFPARHLLPNHLYYSFTSQRKNYTVMLTTTGCRYKCIFCAISKLPYRERSVQNVVDEIQECYDKFNIREIDFFDATFFINRARAMDICREIVRRGIEIEWSCRSRVDLVDDELLQMAYLSGCRKIYYGIESASADTLNNINKNINMNQICDAIKLTKKNKIKALGFFMIGNPGDNKKTILSSIRLAKKLGLDYIQVCRVVAKPNSVLENVLIKNTGIDYWRDYISGRNNDQRLPIPWTILSEAELENYTRKFYRDFYFRPNYIIKKALELKSFDELARYIKVGTKWFFCNKRDALK